MNIITKSYESLLPFLVVEAMSAQTTFQSMSVRMMDRGWAWLVSGRKLLVWKFKESKNQTVTRSRRTLSPCFELQLPQSDLIHKADLTNVFFMPQNPNTSMRAVTVPSAISVSPEGIIRYWSNIANERFLESSVVDMQGQEFCTLACVSPVEYLVGTTTGSVYFLVISATTGTISTSSLTTPASLLSGISRRMTKLFFGPMTPDTAESRKPLIAVGQPSRNLNESRLPDTPFFILSSTFKLRQWIRTNENSTNQNQLVREWDLQQIILKKLTSSLKITDAQRLSFWPVDLVSTRSKELLMLVVTLDSSRNNTINYVTIVFNPYQAGDKLSKTTILRSHSWQYTNETEEQLLSLRFIERCASSPTCFMYDRKFLFLVQVDRDILDAVDYANQDDGILGAGFIDNQTLLFTQRDGLVSGSMIRSKEQECDNDGNNLTGVGTNVTLNSTRPFVSETLNEQSTVISDDTSDIEERLISRLEPNEQSRQNITPPKPASKTSKESKPEEIDFATSTEFEWIAHIDAKRYTQASEVLERLANESEVLKDRQETLIALSKLSRMAA